MAWHLTGEFIETCSCNMLCPCWFGVKELMVMDQGWCRGLQTVRIREGNADGVDIGGRTVVFGVDFPGPTLFDGNGTARVYIDAGASAEQYRALEPIFTGKRGGPMEILGGLVTTWLPTQTAQIEVREDGDTVRVKVGDVGEVRSQLLRDEAGAKFALQGGGFISALRMEAAELAPSAGTRLADPGIPAFETKSGARGAIRWDG
ncbi:MAG TPA: DUF1326 domain-containing protein [Chloroflexota bacterium]|jgi:hypothetical protein|nr:DUF1326 domain-containing protein [Chloroflexota bacterium]